jgi:hypothetical protein
MQGSLRPTFGATLVIGVFGGQQPALLHRGSLPSILEVTEGSIFSLILILYYSLFPVRLLAQPTKYCVILTDRKV